MSKQKPRVFDSTEFEQQQLRRAQYYVNLIESIYSDMSIDIAALALSIPKLRDGIFTFDSYPGLKKRLDDIISSTTVRVQTTLDNGVTDAWNLSDVKNDALVNFAKANTTLGKRKLESYFARNLEALAQTRTPAADLSKNVYNITKQFVRIAEYGIDTGIGEGKGARQLASDIRKAVKDPEFTFRRVRDKNGVLQWSKSFRKYQEENNLVGQTGVYNNPQKNYERLTRTEINRSYRKADNLRYNQMDFVVGIRINLSNNPNHCPLCIALAGVYPKDYKFYGQHPSCRCYATTILKTDDEIERDNVRILRGQEPLKASENFVRTVPDNYKQWLSDHKENIIKMNTRGKLPWFLSENPKYSGYGK